MNRIMNYAQRLHKELSEGQTDSNFQVWLTRIVNDDELINAEEDEIAEKLVASVNGQIELTFVKQLCNWQQQDAERSATVKAESPEKKKKSSSKS